MISLHQINSDKCELLWKKGWQIQSSRLRMMRGRKANNK